MSTQNDIFRQDAGAERLQEGIARFGGREDRCFAAAEMKVASQDIEASRSRRRRQDDLLMILDAREVARKPSCEHVCELKSFLPARSRNILLKFFALKYFFIREIVVDKSLAGENFTDWTFSEMEIPRN